MPNNPMMEALARAANGQGQARQIMTPDQKAAIDAQNHVNVRMAASDQATKLLAGKAPKMDEWRAVAIAVEAFIWGEPQVGDSAPRI